jgi:hypothetical protein
METRDKGLTPFLKRGPTVLWFRGNIVSDHCLHQKEQWRQSNRPKEIVCKGLGTLFKGITLRSPIPAAWASTSPTKLRNLSSIDISAEVSTNRQNIHNYILKSLGDRPHDEWSTWQCYNPRGRLPIADSARCVDTGYNARCVDFMHATSMTGVDPLLLIGQYSNVINIHE